MLLGAFLTQSTIRGLGEHQKQFTIRYAPASLIMRAPQSSSMFICYQSLHRANQTGLNFGLEPYSCPRGTRTSSTYPRQASSSPSPRQNTCPPNGFWEFDAVRRQVGCFVQPRVIIAQTHTHLPITPLPHLLPPFPKMPFVVSDPEVGYVNKNLP